MNYKYGQAMGAEQRLKGLENSLENSPNAGTNVMLGPMVNIARVPMGGRNFESYGEVESLLNSSS